MTQNKKPGKSGNKNAKGAKSYGTRPYAKPNGAKNDKSAPTGAKPYHKRPRVITDSATGAALDVDKRPKKAKNKDSERKAATGSELARAIQWFP